MTTTIRLHSTMSDVHDLYQRLGIKAGTTKVDCGVLRRLLMDHANMYEALRHGTSFKVEEPAG
jgi:hypothetical protein